MTDAWLLTLEKFSTEKESVVYSCSLETNGVPLKILNLHVYLVQYMMEKKLEVFSGIQAVVSEGVVVVLTA